MTATDNSVDGAKESRAILKQFHFRLNSPELVPEQGYRRDSVLYPLICYLNNIAGLFQSKNYDVIPIFVARAAQHMILVPPTTATSAYYQFANSYLCQIVFHLRHFVSGIEHWDDRIPSAMFEAGPQEFKWPR